MDINPVPSGRTTSPGENSPPFTPHSPISSTPPEENTTPDAGLADAPVRQHIRENSGTVIGIQILQEIQRLHGTPLPLEFIEKNITSYAKPPNIREIEEILDKYRVVVLYSRAGTGRYTTAVNLLQKRVKNQIRQVRREPNEKFSFEGSRDEKTGWILDLRDENEVQSDNFGLNLADAADSLRERESYLIVVTHPSLWGESGRKANHLGKELSPPPADEVLAKHLGVTRTPQNFEENVEKALIPHDNKSLPQPHSELIETQNENRPEQPSAGNPGTGRHLTELEEWLHETRVIHEIKNLTPAEVVIWAQNILQVESTQNEHLEHLNQEDKKKQKVNFVVNAANDWRSTLREWHEQNTESEYRNYLLAAAALNGAPVEDIREGALSLATVFEEGYDPKPGQQGKGIIELTYAINAELANDDTVQFTRPGYAKAVVDYFWIDRPNLVAKFTKWTAEQAASLPKNVTEDLADRVSEWALRYSIRKRSVTLLRDIAEEWASTEKLRSHARDLLTAAAMDPKIGQRARSAYLDWAKETVTETTEKTKFLKIALVETCGQLGSVYPKTMLRRLTEMASSPDGHVTETVGRSLGELWDQPRLRPRIKEVIQSWDESGEPAQRRAAHRAFVNLATRSGPSKNPSILSDFSSDDNTEPDWTIDRWRGVLETEATQATQDAFSFWMDFATTSPQEMRMKIFQIFHYAVHRSTEEEFNASRYLKLSHLLNAWEPPQIDKPHTERTHLRDDLLTRARESDPARPRINPNDSTQ